MESRESIDIDFSRYLMILRRRWVLAVSILAVSTTFSFFVATLMKPSYEAAGKLLFRIPSFKVIGSNLLPSSSEGGDSGDLRSLVSTQNPISTQIEVISSPPLLQGTIDKLKLKDNKGEPLDIEALAKDLTLKIVGGTDVLKISYKSRNPAEAAAVVNTIMDLYLVNDILTNRSEAEDTRQSINEQLPNNQSLLRKAEVALRRFKQQNQIINLSEEAKLAVTVIGNLNSEINTVKSQLDEVNAQTNELSRKINLNSQEAIAASVISQSPPVQAILTQLQEIDRQLAIERSRFFDDNPIIINLEAKKANLTSLLQQQIQQNVGSQATVPQGLFQIGELKKNLIQSFLQSEVQRVGLAKKLASLYNSRLLYEQRARKLPNLEQNLHELERNVEVAQSTYETLLKKVQELQVAENRNTSSARVIAKALVPEKPIAGKKLIIVVSGIIFGLFLCTTIILFLELKDKSLKTLQEVREIFSSYSLLGAIPLRTKKIFPYRQNKKLSTRDILIRNEPQSLTSEMYRMIQANLKFINSDKMLKSFVITSASSNEGKSTVSANLAASIAQLGRQVLLIDADMRDPSQDYLWQLSSKAGLSEVLVGEVEFNLALSKVMDNLDVLTAGVRHPNPLALLDSKQMVSLIEDFSHQYDLVIIDAPPLLLSAEALTLSQMTDGILLVARPGVIDTRNARAAQEILEISSCNVLGLIVNGIREKNESISYFSYKGNAEKA